MAADSVIASRTDYPREAAAKRRAERAGGFPSAPHLAGKFSLGQTYHLRIRTEVSHGAAIGGRHAPDRVRASATRPSRGGLWPGISGRRRSGADSLPVRSRDRLFLSSATLDQNNGPQKSMVCPTLTASASRSMLGTAPPAHTSRTFAVSRQCFDPLEFLGPGVSPRRSAGVPDPPRILRRRYGKLRSSRRGPWCWPGHGKRWPRRRGSPGRQPRSAA